MYDMHYDLLTVLYYNFVIENNHANLKTCITNIKSTYAKGNVRGGIVNLYFMNEKEMKSQLRIEKKHLDNVPLMFKNSVILCEKLKEEKLVPKNVDFLFGIEGCDYIKSLEELEILHNMGLRSIILTWNNKNKYGSGIKGYGGLTQKGKQFIKKAIDLGIIIDLSHANARTFNDIIKVIKKEQDKGKTPIVIASHSNCRKICKRKRNLTDKQLIALRNIGGTIGLFSNSNFLSLNAENMNYEERMEKYVEHIKHVMDLGFDTSKIVLSTDDMNFEPDISFHELETFPLSKIKTETEKLLKKHFDTKTVNKLMYENSAELIKKVKNKKRNR